MKFEISSGRVHGGTIELIDNNGAFDHSYWLQVKDRNGKQLLVDVTIGKEDLKRIARATNNV